MKPRSDAGAEAIVIGCMLVAGVVIVLSLISSAIRGLDRPAVATSIQQPSPSRPRETSAYHPTPTYRPTSYTAPVTPPRYTAPPTLPGDESVRGYYRKNGTYVRPYNRTRANSSTSDNYSTRGNVNPYTGKKGSHRP